VQGEMHCGSTVEVINKEIRNRARKGHITGSGNERGRRIKTIVTAAAVWDVSLS
jgi:hypothetical protein